MSPATLDLAVLGLLLLFTVAGAFSGALQQLAKLAAVLAGWLVARRAAPPLAALAWGARPPPWARSVAAAVIFVVMAVLVGLAGRAVARRLHGPSGRPGALDRAGGALLGGAKAALVAWLVLSILARLGPIAVGSFRLDARRSDFGAVAARHDLLELSVPDQARRLERLLEAARDPAERARLLARDPGWQRLLDDPRFKALMERGGTPDPGLLLEPQVKALLEKAEEE
jgi:membrane protein required for colicin V production